MVLGLAKGEIVASFVCRTMAAEDRSLNPLDLADALPDTG